MGLYRRFVFPKLVEWTLSRREVADERAAALEAVRGRVLEIGFGTGLNLEFYPVGVESLVAVDANPGMSPKALDRIRRSAIPVEHRLLDSRQLPLEDASFDSVVSTWTLCSIPDVDRALQEAVRVLKPGGSFFFLEHGLSPDSSTARWQRFLTPIHKRIADGCHLDRDIRSLVAGSGLQVIEIENHYLPDSPRPLGYTYRGRARRV